MAAASILFIMPLDSHASHPRLRLCLAGLYSAAPLFLFLYQMQENRHEGTRIIIFKTHSPFYKFPTFVSFFFFLLFFFVAAFS